MVDPIPAAAPTFFELIHCALVGQLIGYAGDAEGAFAQFERDEPAYKSSPARLVASWIVQPVHASAALDCAWGDGPKAALARRKARRLGRELGKIAAHPYRPHGLAIEAALARQRGDSARAMQLLAECEEAFSTHEMLWLALMARRHRGRLLGGDEGTQLVREVDRELEAQGVSNPERYSHYMLGGFRQP